VIGGPAPQIDPAPVPTEFDGDRAFANVAALVTQYPRRTTGSEADTAAAAWMADQFAAIGLPVVEQQPFETWGSYGLGGLARFRGRNVVAVSPGQDEQALVLGAHRDVVPATVEGAEDNASGSGVLLELARVLSRGPHRLTYVFVSFGAEEVGLGGSRYYLADPTYPPSLALSIDTVGRRGGTQVALIDAWSLPAAAAEDLARRVQAADLLSRPPERDPLALARLGWLRGDGVTDSLPFALRGQPAVGVA
jgi:hypothetical protein